MQQIILAQDQVMVEISYRIYKIQLTMQFSIYALVHLHGNTTLVIETVQQTTDSTFIRTDFISALTV